MVVEVPKNVVFMILEIKTALFFGVNPLQKVFQTPNLFVNLKHWILVFKPRRFIRSQFHNTQNFGASNSKIDS